VFGSVPYDTETNACAASSVNFREKQYYQLGNTLYDNLTDAQSGTRSVFPYTQNYILTDSTTFLIVNKDGRLQSRGGCRLPEITVATSPSTSNFSSQTEACRRKIFPSSVTTFGIKDNRLKTRVSGYFSGTGLSGRYSIYEGSGNRPTRNVIFSSGRIIGYETCGSELTDITLSSGGFPSSRYDFTNPSTISPTYLKYLCESYDNFVTFQQGPDGTIYYGFKYKDGKYSYVPIAGNRWYKKPDGSFVLIVDGQITDTTNPC
jgi:hypothetical protein